MNSDPMTGPATGPADARGRVGGSAEAASPAALRWEVRGRRHAAFTTDFDYHSGP